MESVAASSGCEDLLQREQKVDALEQLVALKQELVNLKQENMKLNQDYVNLVQKGDALGQAGATLVERAKELKEASVDQLAREAELVAEIKQLKEASADQLFKGSELVAEIKRMDDEIAELNLAEIKRKDDDELKELKEKQSDRVGPRLRALESKVLAHERQLCETAKDVEELDKTRKRRDDDLHAYTTNGDNHCLERCRRIEAHLGLASPSP